MNQHIEVAIVDDKRDIREGLQLIIDNADGFKCVATYSDGESAAEGLPNVKPDVVLMDIGLPKMSGIDCVKILKDKAPEIDIIMLTVHSDSDYIFESLRAGAVGYLVKNIFPSKLLNSIKEVKSGGSPMSSSIARKVVSSFNSFRKPAANLTKREKEVLDLLCQGKSYKVIADDLFISPDTVRYHLKNIYKKLQVNSKYEAVIKALKNGMV
ncbi:MAG: DNA-binding NarL/FixJ family response regulator [Saprospiraceae bacterium]|jgi:DNA-binding NarL/FixJ family response regulator